MANLEADFLLHCRLADGQQLHNHEHDLARGEAVRILGRVQECRLFRHGLLRRQHHDRTEQHCVLRHLLRNRAWLR